MTSSTTPRTILGTDYILDALAAEGLGHLFMVPGGLVDPFLPALARQRKLTPVVAFCVTTTWPSTAIWHWSSGVAPEPQSGQ